MQQTGARTGDCKSLTAPNAKALIETESEAIRRRLGKEESRKYHVAKRKMGAKFHKIKGGETLKQAHKARRCDSITPETITDRLTHSLTHPLTGVTAKR